MLGWGLLADWLTVSVTGDFAKRTTQILSSCLLFDFRFASSADGDKGAGVDRQREGREETRRLPCISIEVSIEAALGFFMRLSRTVVPSALAERLVCWGVVCAKRPVEVNLHEWFNCSRQ